MALNPKGLDMDVISSPFVALAQATPAVAAPDVIAPQGLDSMAAARFSAIMAQPQALSGAAAVPEVPTAAVTGVGAGGASSMGERILSGMQGASGDMQASWKNIAGVLEGGDRNVNMHDMLRLQMNLMQVTMQYELVGKAVSRAGQNIDHLVRLQ